MHARRVVNARYLRLMFAMPGEVEHGAWLHISAQQTCMPLRPVDVLR